MVQVVGRGRPSKFLGRLFVSSIRRRQRSTFTFEEWRKRSLSHAANAQSDVRMNANQLVLDYVWTCEKRGEVLNLAAFVPLWIAAHEAAQDRAEQDFPEAERGLRELFVPRSQR